MTNFLENGTIIPHGLLSVCDPSDFLRGFNKSYNSTALRFGVIRKIYPVSDPGNISKLSTEYDVEVIEQDMNRGVAPVTYKNCLSVDSLGGIGDFFEKNFRAQTQSANLQLPLTKGQDGATVLVLCLDATTGKGVVLGGLNHPDRSTTLISTDPHLEGEYNGVNIKVNSDGSTALTFKGATDSHGVPTDSSQGPTAVTIEKDGSFQVMHKSVTFRLDKQGTVTVTATKDVVVNCDNATITASGDATITATGKATIEGEHVNLGKNASDAVIKGDTFKKYLDALSVATALGPSGPPILPMPPTSLSTKVKTE